MGLNDKWLELIGNLADKGIPLDKVVMPLEEKGVPTLYLVLGLVVLVLAAVGWFAFSGGGGSAPSAKLTVKVLSGGQTLEGASVTVLAGGELVKTFKSGSSPEVIDIPGSGNITIRVSKEGCDKFEKSYQATDGMVISARLDCTGGGGECLEDAKQLKIARIYVGESFGRNCQVSITNESGARLDLGWKILRKNKIVFSYDKDNCPKSGYKVEVKCENALKSFPMEDFISSAKSGKIKLPKNDQGGGQPNNNADVVDSVYVHVKAEDGSDIAGIKVIATDASGNELQLGYSNIVTTAVSDYTGNALIVLPKGQSFYLKATDPSGNRPPSNILGPYNSQNGMQLEITMKSGFESEIDTIDDSGNPVPLANVMLYSSNNTLLAQYQTDSAGSITVKLDKGSYKAMAMKDGYAPATKTFEGGQTVKVTMTELNANNSGSVTVHVTNANTQQPMSGVTMYLETTDGIVIGMKQTDDNGTANFGLVAIGSYMIHIPASDRNLGTDQYSEVFYVNASQVSNIEMQITPPQVTFDITTNVKGFQKDGVYVEVYDVTYNPYFPKLIDAGESEYPGQLKLSVDKGSKVYLVASFTYENEVYGPLVTDVIDANDNKQITLNLTEITLNQTAYIDGVSPVNGEYSINSGQEYDIILPVNLPYYEEQSKTPFDEVDVEVMVGELGNVSNPNASPIYIKDFDALTLNSGTQNANFQVKKSDAVTSWDGPSQTVEDDQLQKSKYVKVIITGYSSKMTYNLRIPIYALLTATAKNTHVYFRTTWIKNTGEGTGETGEVVYKSKESGNWDGIPVEVTPADSSWRIIQNDYFYAYKRWMSADTKGNIVTRTLVDGQPAHLHILAISNRDSSGYSFCVEGFEMTDVSIETVKVNGNPSSASVISHTSNSFCISGGSINEGDRVDMTIKLSPNIAIPANEKTIRSLKMFRDGMGAMQLTIVSAGEIKPTPVPDVVGSVRVASYVKYNDTGGNAKECWFEQDDIVDAFRPDGSPRKILISLSFENTGGNNKDFTVGVSGANFTILNATDNVSAIPPSCGVNQLVGDEVNTTTFTREIEIPPEGNKTIVIIGNVSNEFDGYARDLNITINGKPWMIRLMTKASYDFNITSLVRQQVISHLVYGADMLGVGIIQRYKNKGGTTSSREVPLKPYWVLNVNSPSYSEGKMVSPTGNYFVVYFGGGWVDLGINNEKMYLYKSYSPPFGFNPATGSSLGNGNSVTGNVYISNTNNETINTSVYTYHPLPSGDSETVKINGDPTNTKILNQDVNVTITASGSDKTINWFIIDIKDLNGNLIATAEYPFSLTGGGATTTSVATYARETNDPYSILSEGGCGISGGTVHICDADQFVAELMHIASEEEETGYSQTFGPIALGKESLNSDTINAIIEDIDPNFDFTACSKQNDSQCGEKGEKEIVLNVSRVNCGEIYVDAVGTPTGDIEANIEATGAPWCAGSSGSNGSWLLGMLNYDGISRNQGLVSTNPYALGGAGANLTKGFSDLGYSALEETFGTYSGASSDWTVLESGSPTYNVNYHETRTQSGSTNCADFSYTVTGNNVDIYVNASAMNGDTQNAMCHIYKWLTGQTTCSQTVTCS